ncbi:MAG: hypothetical protein K2M42_00840 [Oscillospiraceae bacterium]|nr:hypothetical protein [Oscillospiraceae bacterium]
MSSRSGFILDAVGLCFLPLSALGGIPHLAAQFFRSVQKAAPKELLRRGLDFFFCFFGDRAFFFDFCDITPPYFLFSWFCDTLPEKERVKNGASSPMRVGWERPNLY